jgi:putative isomerase
MNTKPRPLVRRDFLRAATASLAALALPAWRVGPRNACAADGAYNTAATLATKTLAAEYLRMMKEKGLKRQAVTGLLYPTSYGGTLYDWDLYFDSLALLYYGLDQPAMDGVRMFLRSQQQSGFICRRIVPDPAAANSGWGRLENEEHCKPFLCQLALVVSRVRGNVSWLSGEELTRLDRYLDYWLTVCDADRNGLSEWQSAPHSGADTQLSRAGTWRSRYCEAVDLNCYLYVEWLAAAELARAAGKPEMAARLAREAERKKARIQALWDKTDSFFYDRDRHKGTPIRVRSAAAFLTLWAGVASRDQAHELVQQHLTNPREFWTPLPVPSYARSEPSYTQRYEPPAGADPIYALPSGHCNWCGGMWPHWNYLIIHGLEDYGFHEEARAIAAKWLTAASSPSGLYEWYNAETGKGEGSNPFWAGSSILGVIVPTELRHGVNPTAVTPATQRLDLQKVREDLSLDR